MSPCPVLSRQNKCSTVLIASADPGFRSRIQALLDDTFWSAEEVAGGAEAIAALDGGSSGTHFLLIDRGLPDLEPVELAGFVHNHHPNLHVCILDSEAGDNFTPEAIPGLAPTNELSDLLRLFDRRQSSAAAPTLPVEAKPRTSTSREILPGMVSASAEMVRVARLVRLVSPRKTSVLLQGETGTGKELLARAIHHLSPRASAPFVAVNCAAIPEALLESEMFGNARGAFTGALQARIGKVQAAEKGTLLLDEVGQLALSLQAKLLRFLQEGEVQRLGSVTTEYPDVRVIAATNSRLETAVREGRFRADLFYRLAVFPIALPPLRSRVGDVEMLAEHALEEFCRAAGQASKRISTQAMRLLRQHSWPGNVRELRHAIERALILSEDESLIEPGHLLPFFSLES